VANLLRFVTTLRRKMLKYDRKDKKSRIISAPLFLLKGLSLLGSIEV
jgi:hypothetical protein